MDCHYLLYIDILGFRKLVKDPARVDDLYEIVASLNAHRHSSFEVVGFSDTILIYNIMPAKSDYDRHYLVMYQCEFARDLMHRLAGREIAFRAVLTYGAFTHYRLNNSPYYYGTALNTAYDLEKSLKITGLVMDDHCRDHSDIFSTRPLRPGWHYVFMTQALDYFEDTWEAHVPLEMVELDEAGLGWMLGPELEMLHFTALMAREHTEASVRDKYKATLTQYAARYPNIFSRLAADDFRMEVVNPRFDWSRVRARLRDDYSGRSVRTISSEDEV